jgi:hypothetical protein
LIFVAFVLCVVCAVWLTGALTGQSFTEVVRDSFRRYQLRQQQALLQATMGTQQESIRIDITAGMSTMAIAQLLYEHGLIVDVDVFVLYTVVNQLDAQLEAGVYFLSQTMTIPEIATRLTDTNSSKITFRILEGWRTEEIAQAIDQTPAFTFSGADFLLATQQDASSLTDFMALVGLPEERTLEGFLLPGTYFVPPTATGARTAQHPFAGVQQSDGDGWFISQSTRARDDPILKWSRLPRLWSEKPCMTMSRRWLPASIRTAWQTG